MIVGRGILISTTVITSLYLNYRFRARMKIRNYGILPTVLGLAVSPAAVTAIVHTEVLMEKPIKFLYSMMSKEHLEDIPMSSL